MSTFNQEPPKDGHLALLACPFCEFVPSHVDYIEAHTHFLVKMPDFPGCHYVECVACDFRIFGDDAYQASKRWNTRSPKTTAATDGGDHV